MAGNSVSQRKSTTKKRYGTGTSSSFGKKKGRASNQGINKPNGQRAKKNQLLQMQQYQQQFQSMPNNEAIPLDQGQPQAAGQNLVEMPILSEEFLNQLNEEQLQSLLEQQQRLMML